jgi:8-oxo-dGTP pyrophosphatase MutT (NUDIX family)
MTSKNINLVELLFRSKEGLRLAAGIVFHAKNTNKYLFLKRSMTSPKPGTWAFVGGKIDTPEEAADPSLAARRECMEEVGFDTTGIPLKLIHITKNPGFRFYTYYASLPEEFIPKLNSEHLNSVWTDIKTCPQPLHPGVSSMLRVFEETGQNLSNADGIVDALKNTPSLSAMKNLVEDYGLTEIGHGLTRVVYALDDQRVLKIARTPQATKYNEREYEYSSCPGAEKYLAKVLEHDVKFRWIVMERAEVNEQKIERIIAGWFRVPTTIHNMFGKLGSSPETVISLLKPKFEGGNVEEWLINLAKMVKKCGVQTTDFHTGNIGIRKNTGELIFIDYADYDFD